MIRCKLCHSSIKIPDEALVIGLSEEQRIGIIAGALAIHMSHEGGKEAEAQQKSIRRGNGVTNVVPPAPHAQLVQQCVQQGAVMGQLVQGLLTLRAFHLTPDLERYAETHRASLHAWSRKVRMTDAELERRYRDASACGDAQPMHGPLWDMYCDLRDRYEELGKYAPAAPQAEKPEGVKL